MSKQMVDIDELAIAVMHGLQNMFAWRLTA